MSVLICPGCRTTYEAHMEVCPRDNLPLIVRSPSMMEEPDAGEGTTLSSGLMVGEYRIEGPISEDDMGTTYAALHPLIRKRVAIRVLHKRFAEDHRAVSRFVMEARAVNEIGHHNIVDVLSIGELWDGRNYLVMELLDGLNLQEILRRERTIEPGILIPLFEQICDALDAVHEANFIHRDLKPETIVVLRRPPRPFVKIQDFGMAKLKGQDDSETDVATLVGTPVYMAPELCTGAESDTRADIYSLGVILYEALAGRPPYAAQELLAAFGGGVPPRPPAPSTLTPTVPPDLDRVVFEAMAWDRDGRFPTVRALWDRLALSTPERLPWSINLDPPGPRNAPVKPVGTDSAVPLARPPEPRPGSALAPEALVGEVQEAELATKQADRRVLHLRPEPLAAEPPEGEMEEAPTDIFTGSGPGEDLKPSASLGRHDSLELETEDTEISDPPLTPEPAMPGASVEVTVKRAVGSHTLVGMGPGSRLDDTTRTPALGDTPEPQDDEEGIAEEPTALAPEPQDDEEEIAEEPTALAPAEVLAAAAAGTAEEPAEKKPAEKKPAEDAATEDDPYVSLEITAKPPGDKSD